MVDTHLGNYLSKAFSLQADLLDCSWIGVTSEQDATMEYGGRQVNPVQKNHIFNDMDFYITHWRIFLFNAYFGLVSQHKLCKCTTIRKILV